MANEDLKILCVDDEADILEIFKTSVLEAGYTPILCTSPKEAIRQYRQDPQNILLVLSDYQMPEMNGFEFRRTIAKDGFAIPFVIISSYVTKEMALKALDLKIDEFCDKPFNHSQIMHLIEKHGKPRLETIRESQALEAVFIEEATSIIDEMDAVLLELDHDRTNKEKLNLIFRGAHTIKGSSGVLSTNVVTRYVHKYEDIISGVKKEQIEFDDQVYEILLKGFDRIKEFIVAASAKKLRDFNLEKLLPELDLGKKLDSPSKDVSNNEPSKSQASPQAAAQKPKDNISVPISTLEQLSGCSGEITVIRNMVNKLVKGLEVQYVGNKDIQNLSELLEEMHKINGTIQTYITDLRKVPLSGVLKPIPRIIRDLSKDLGKSIELKIEGEKLRVDNAVATVCSNSLVHLVRNSADHGIEDLAKRRSLGKPESGTIRISCKQIGEEVHISIQDDGKGIDPDMIRNKALEKGLYTKSQLSEMNEQQILGIIFASGFSTAAKVTDVSGRGVGMDMVRSSVEAVGGQILIDSKPGQGSTFNLKLPIPKSVLIITALIVEAGGQCFAVHQDVIERVMRIESEKYNEMVQMASTGRTLRCGNDVLPLISLSNALKLPKVKNNSSSSKSSQTISVLILQSEGLRYALEVDEIQDAEEIVVNRISSYFNTKSAFVGATFMGDGSVGLIIDIKGIGELAGIKPEANIKNANYAKDISPKGPQAKSTRKDFLLFKLAGKAMFGIPLEQVFRLEEFESSKVQFSGAEHVVIYRDGVMPLYSMEKLLHLKPTPEKKLARFTPSGEETIKAIVAKSNDSYFGLQVNQILDIASSEEEISQAIRDRRGVAGNTFIDDQNVTILDLAHVLGTPLSA